MFLSFAKTDEEKTELENSVAPFDYFTLITVIACKMKIIRVTLRISQITVL